MVSSYGQSLRCVCWDMTHGQSHMITSKHGLRVFYSTVVECRRPISNIPTVTKIYRPHCGVLFNVLNRTECDIEQFFLRTTIYSIFSHLLICEIKREPTLITLTFFLFCRKSRLSFLCLYMFLFFIYKYCNVSTSL